MPDLISAFTKIDQADTHLRTFEQSVLDFLNGQPHRVRLETRYDPPYEQGLQSETFERSEVEARGLDQIEGFIWLPDGRGDIPRILFEHSNVYLVLDAEPSVIGTAWSAMVGDVVHNLRSALDHLVFALTVKHTSPAPDTPGGKLQWWRHVGFPVMRRDNWKLDRFGNPTELDSLHGVEPRLWARIRDVQPHRDSPESELLWVLNELWNWDKHRSIATITMLAEVTRVQIVTLPDQPQEFDAEMVEIVLGGPARHDAHLGIAKISKRRPEITDRNIEVPMYIGLTYKVLFEQGAPAYGRVVYETLEEMSRLVRKIIQSFAAEFP